MPISTVTVGLPVKLVQVSSPPHESYESHNSSFRYDSAERRAMQYIKELEEWKTNADIVHAENKAAYEENAKNKQILEDFMLSLGIRSYSERDTKSRSRFPKYVTRDPGYLADLRRVYHNDDGYASAVYSYNEKLRRAQAYLAKASAEQAMLKEKAEAERKESKSLIELGKMAAKHNEDVGSWREMIHVLRSKCKYLHLASAMEAVRCSWADGPGKVRDALYDFDCDNDTERDIVSCIESCLEDFEDGRVFRDCEWSYDALYHFVDDDLMRDFRTACEQPIDWWECI